jgi:wyosine [tRNA(Phe)-imidazoG37] synthetase (radical SAM superfamily)
MMSLYARQEFEVPAANVTLVFTLFYVSEEVRLPSYKFVKGVNEIGGLGSVLGVDFSPHKVCSFNCMYCGVGPTTRKIIDREEFYPVEDVFDEIRDHIEKNGEPDYVMLTGSGEPTLYSGFGRLAETIQEAFPNAKPTLYTNGSLFHHQDVRDQVSLCDLVMINLNAVDETVFRRICRPHREVALGSMIDGIKQFRAQYTGPLWMDVVLVKGVNDSEEMLERLMDTVMDIKPDLYRVRTVRQAVEGKVEPVSSEFGEHLKEKWENIPLEIAYAF